MKRKYTKPSLVMERFEMTQSIAAGCSAASSSTVGDPNIWSKTDCGWAVGSDVIWDMDVTGSKCNFDWDLDADFSGICYNNPNGGQSIFGSY